MDAYFMIEKTQLPGEESIPKDSFPSIEELSKGKTITLESKEKSVAGKKKKKRCGVKGCKKKITLLSFTCQCEKIFCTEHRMPEQHNCSFDWVEHGRCIIAKKNPQVINSKITQI